MTVEAWTPERATAEAYIALQDQYRTALERIEELEAIGRWLLECWGHADYDYYRPDMDDAIDALRKVIPVAASGEAT